jgi:hypothetical protein
MHAAETVFRGTRPGVLMQRVKLEEQASRDSEQ